MTLSGHCDLRSAGGIVCKLVLTNHEWWCMLYATLQTEYAIRSVIDAYLWTSLKPSTMQENTFLMEGPAKHYWYITQAAS